MEIKRDIEIYEKGLEEFPLSKVISGNIAMLMLIILGAIACSFISKTAALVYLVTAILMVYFVMRKLVCTNCYYYGKRCAIGWGKLSELLFSQGDIKLHSSCTGMKIAPVTYALLSLIPLIFCIAAIVQEITAYKIIVLILLITVSLYSGIFGRKESCRNCKMRLICPGSAVK